MPKAGFAEPMRAQAKRRRRYNNPVDEALVLLLIFFNR